MRRKRHRKLRLAAVLAIVVLLALVLVYCIRIVPLVRSLGMVQVENELSDMVTLVVDRELAREGVKYDSLIAMEKAPDGSILALKTNMAAINDVKTRMVDVINDELSDLDSFQLGVPLGNIIMPSALSGLGPKIPIKILAMSNAGSDFISDFSSAGINQTKHQISVRVSLDVTVLTVAGLQQATVDTTIVVAETVIVGDVPGTVLGTYE